MGIIGKMAQAIMYLKATEAMGPDPFFVPSLNRGGAGYHHQRAARRVRVANKNRLTVSRRTKAKHRKSGK